MIETVGEIAGRLSKAQRDMMLGNYEVEDARIEDAGQLEQLGLWSFDPAKQNCDVDYYEMDVTPLGLAVRAHLGAHP